MTLIILALLAYAGLTYFRPHFGVYITLLLLPAYQIRFNVFGLPTTILEWLILILALITLLKLLTNAEFRHTVLARLKIGWSKNQALVIFCALFFVAASIAALASPETNKALGIWKAYVVEAMLFGLLFYLLIDTKEKLIKTFEALGLLVIGLSAFGLYQFFTLYRLPPAWWGPGLEPRRVVSLYTYPNAVSLLIAPILGMFTALLALWSKLPQKMFSKKFAILTLAFGLVLLILTFSRGAWIGYAAAVFLIALFTKHRKLILSLAIAGAILIFLIPATRNRLLPIFNGSDPASQERVLLYRGTWEIIKDKPISGAGFYGFRGAYEQVRESETDEILNYPHNFFLNFWVETGILGLLSVLAVIFLVFRKGIKFFGNLQEFQPIILATLAVLVVILVHGQFDVPYFKNDLSVLFWMIIAIIPTMVAVPLTERKQQ